MSDAPSDPGERPLESWPDALEAACAGTRHFRRVRVLRETASTQDAATRLELPAGEIVTAGRQVAGRGRLGAAWEDTRGEGLAVTFTLPPLPPERLGMAAAVAAAEAVIASLPQASAGRAGIKWPNDVVATWPGSAPRKLSGVLVERTDRLALVGIGVNVRQAAFVDELAGRAASLAMMGSTADRLQVLLELLVRLDHWLQADDAVLAEGYRRLDRTAGLHLRFRTPAGTVEGTVLSCDPLHGLRVRTVDGEVMLPSATTRVQPDALADRSRMDGP